MRSFVAATAILTAALVATLANPAPADIEWPNPRPSSVSSKSVDIEWPVVRPTGGGA
ncbi:hypothetical protein [Streptomyces sp. WAC06614]|uniref:hypothetical protein n=1 Tax=Streptomyces sp. WAC06614 TaxID=2487416 RepID=UPI00163CE13D|nr:hypothetical protein [Streptomyces sp. WAC06614]